MNRHFRPGPVVNYRRADLSMALDAVGAALRDPEHGLFQSHGVLVRVIRIDRAEEGDGIRRPRGALIIRTVNEHYLVEIFGRAVRFQIWDAQKGKFVAHLPRIEFAKHFIARGEWDVPILSGIVEAPTLREDGSVLVNHGYDTATGIYLDTGGVAFPEIPDQPTRADALAALALLKNPIQDFPFVPDREEADLGAPSAARSVALSAILTAICRKGIRTAPIHALDATNMGTGKTLLADVVSIIASGRAIAAISQGKSEEEFNKRLFSVLRQGDPIILIDNIDQPVRSDELSTIVTVESWQCRVLGSSVNNTVPTNVLFLMNGNGLQFEGDISTRVITCRLDARVEDPTARVFDRDLRKYVPERRPELVAAALTMLRAHIVAGYPGEELVTPYGRFEDWSRLVRGALVWLGEPDPCATRAAIEAIDPERDALAALMRAWRDHLGTRDWITAKDILDRANGLGASQNFDPKGELQDALTALVPHHLGPKTLGRNLMRYKDRIIDSMRIRVHAIKGESTRYRLEVIES